MKEHLTYKEMDRRIEYFNSMTVKCECGHSVTVANKYKRKICTWCGRYVYLDPKDKFKNKLERLMKK